MSQPDTIERWAADEQHRDQLQAELDRLDAFENLDVRNRDDAERERLDREITEAEIAFQHGLGDHGRVAELESDRMHAELATTEGAHGLLADLRRQHGEDG